MNRSYQLKEIRNFFCYNRSKLIIMMEVSVLECNIVCRCSTCISLYCTHHILSVTQIPPFTKNSETFGTCFMYSSNVMFSCFDSPKFGQNVMDGSSKSCLPSLYEIPMFVISLLYFKNWKMVTVNRDITNTNCTEILHPFCSLFQFILFL